LTRAGQFQLYATFLIPDAVSRIIFFRYMPATPGKWHANETFGLSEDLELEEGLLTEWWKLRCA
jgi:hypothetical protein